MKLADSFKSIFLLFLQKGKKWNKNKQKDKSTKNASNYLTITRRLPGFWFSIPHLPLSYFEGYVTMPMLIFSRLGFLSFMEFLFLSQTSVIQKHETM